MKKRYISIPVEFFREGKYFVAYSHPLDFSAHGKTFREARKNFAEAANIFFDELEEKGTVKDVLLELGWQKVNKTFQPPVRISEEEIKIPCPI